MNVLEQRLVESRQRALDLANRLEEADRRACAAEQQCIEKDAALGALAEAARALMASHAGLGFNEPKQGEPHTGWDLQQALLPDAVQQAVEASKAKAAEIERLITELADEKIRSDVYDENYFEEHKKLAVAMGLLKRALRPTYLATSLHDPTAAEIAAFLADPSQAASRRRSHE